MCPSVRDKRTSSESDQIMEEEVNYVTVTFKTNSSSAHGEKNDLEAIYDEVKTEKQELYTDPVLPENKKKAPVCSLLHLVAAGLGIVCVILASVVVGLTIHFNAVVSEQHRENGNLTAQNLQLSTAKADLERQKEELSRERDGLNWTIGVILEYETFPVNSHCPQKVCKPCLDDWVLFQSNCYRFAHFEYYSYWRNWEGSRNACKQMQADLVVIESEEEQEFINNNTEEYDDENHGYWIGWSSRYMDARTWVDGSNVTVTYWRTQEESYSESCAVTRPRPRPQPDPLANWSKVGCSMRNRWICETRALIKESDAVSKLV